MIKKLFIPVTGAVFLLLVYRFSFKDVQESPDDLLPVKVMSYRTATGWGYEINIDGKTFIHQDVIPAVQGNKSFASSEDALKVGEFVMNKMKSNQKPTITVEELKSMKIKDM